MLKKISNHRIASWTGVPHRYPCFQNVANKKPDLEGKGPSGDLQIGENLNNL